MSDRWVIGSGGGRMWRFDTKKGPLYLQLADMVITQLLRGEVKPGDKLPSARDFAVKVGINPNTVIQGFIELENRGITEKQRGRGTYIRRDANIQEIRDCKLEEMTSHYLENVKLIGLSPVEVLAIIKEKIDDED